MIQNIKISTNLGREKLYELGRKGVYYRTVDFPIKVSQILKNNMTAKFKIGDKVILKDLTGVDEPYNGMKSIVTGVNQNTYFYTYYTYDIYVEEYPTNLSNIYEANICLSTDFCTNEVWPPKCTCPREVWMYSGCDCGAMKKERQMIQEGKNIMGENNTSVEITI